jgi:hypothetical protein
MTGIGRGTLPSDHWQQSVSVWLWRYSSSDRNYPGWHLTADRAGASSLIGLLEVLISGNQSVFRTVQLGRPTPAIFSVPNNRNAEWTAPSKLRIGVAADPNEWIFTCADATAHLTLGRNWCPMLRQALSGVPLGKGDFSIGQSDSAQRLWLWWYLS